MDEIPRTRRQKRRRPANEHQPQARPEPKLPGVLGTKLADVGLELARASLLKRRWHEAFEFAQGARAANPVVADALMAEACAREARRAALCGRFAEAEQFARRAVELRPTDSDYQERRRLIRCACDAALRGTDQPLFEDTFGPSRDEWWRHDLLARVRGYVDGVATVPRPRILKETTRGQLEDIYAVGRYTPWHVGGATPLFTKYVKALKPGGSTIQYAAILLRQGLTEETDWVEDIDVVVPVPTALRSFEQREFELTEELAADVAKRLCIPTVDAFESDPEGRATHALGAYAQRAKALSGRIRVKQTRHALLAKAEALVLVDDIVTYGSTFEACAIRLRDHYPHLRVYGAALAYTDTPERRARAEAESDIEPEHAEA